MYIIAGLGNPAARYAGTRHNTGFMVLDKLAEKYEIAVTQKKHRALIGTGQIGEKKVLLAKPQTFMNLSGESLVRLRDFYQIDVAKELIVLYDDIDLGVGQIRVRGKGSAGGHNGMKSIISALGTETFLRVRVGIGQKPPGWDLADYVLSRFSGDEQPLMEEACEEAAQAVTMLLTEGLDAAMNTYNRKQKP